MDKLELSCKIGLSFREVLIALILAGFLGTGALFVLQPTPDTPLVPIVQQEAVQSVVEAPACGDSQPTAPEGCRWGLICE